MFLALAASGCTTAQDIAPACAAVHLLLQFHEIRGDRHRRLKTARLPLQTAAEAPPTLVASLTEDRSSLYMLFEAMDSGRVLQDDLIPSPTMRARGLRPRSASSGASAIDVEAAILAVVTKSANDVAAAIAEYFGGSEDNFAAMMTAKARQIGMRSTTFRNASGLPDPGQVTTARDMALLGVALRKRFPQYYAYFSTNDFSYRGRTIRGHNDLIEDVDGVDGIKTGYTRASGFNVVTSVSRGDQKIVAVVMGGDSARGRNANMAALIDATCRIATSF